MDNLKMGIAEYMFFAFIVLALGGWMLYTTKLDNERMSINYCFDSLGNHYVSPDNRCSH